MNVAEAQFRMRKSRINPNLLFEWNEAKRYPEFEEMGKDGWVTYATRNGSTVNFSQIKTHLGNVNLDLSKLDKNKRKRFDVSPLFKLALCEFSFYIFTRTTKEEKNVWA